MKTIIPALFFFVIPCFLFGQQNITFKGGISISSARASYGYRLGTQTLDGDVLFENTLGGYAGVSYEAALSSFFSVVPELAYIAMGYGYPKESQHLEFLHPAHFDYISLPIAIKYKANDHFGIFAGGYVSYMFHGSPLYDASSSNFDWVPSTDLRKRFDVGIQIGAEALVYKNFGVGLRYFYGLYDIDLDKTGDDRYELYNRSFQCYAFYKLKLKRKSGV